ncbi:hypothetical protein [Lysinibacillus sp. fls2-241-R2A-57]|uniref:hypothetical protein n=1 Tax=Lysinibacillus sp. fls2-241-R2A-57 TaxID=3040292 RepID=UPI0025558A50|nr:hypothetical protein [Lysinibacillus sp. fls2-241-R2A-57]
MDKEKFFKEVEELLKDIGDKQLPKNLQVTITYSTGEKDVLKVSEVFWANVLVATKNRDKYLYIQDRLISLDHVVKMQFKKLNK